MDVAHLSQTLYLLCSDMGLGAFFTAACNEIEAEALLGIDGVDEGVLAVGGCGIPVEGENAMALHSKPYSPKSN